MNPRRRRLIDACRTIARNLNIREHVRQIERILDRTDERQRHEADRARREYAHHQQRRGDAQ